MVAFSLVQTQISILIYRLALLQNDFRARHLSQLTQLMLI